MKSQVMMLWLILTLFGIFDNFTCLTIPPLHLSKTCTVHILYQRSSRLEAAFQTLIQSNSQTHLLTITSFDKHNENFGDFVVKPVINFLEKCTLNIVFIRCKSRVVQANMFAIMDHSHYSRMKYLFSTFVFVMDKRKCVKAETLGTPLQTLPATLFFHFIDGKKGRFPGYIYLPLNKPIIVKYHFEQAQEPLLHKRKVQDIVKSNSVPYEVYTDTDGPNPICFSPKRLKTYKKKYKCSFDNYIFHALQQIHNFSVNSDASFFQPIFGPSLRTTYQEFLIWGEDNVKGFAKEMVGTIIYFTEKKETDRVLVEISLTNLVSPFEVDVWMCTLSGIACVVFYATIKLRTGWKTIPNIICKALFTFSRMFLDQNSDSSTISYLVVYIVVFYLSSMYKQYYMVSLIFIREHTNFKNWTELYESGYRLVTKDGVGETCDAILAGQYAGQGPMYEVCADAYKDRWLNGAVEYSSVLRDLVETKNKYALLTFGSGSTLRDRLIRAGKTDLNVTNFTNLDLFVVKTPILINQNVDASNPIGHYMIDSVKLFLNHGLLAFWRDMEVHKLDFQHQVEYKMSKKSSMVEERVGLLSISGVCISCGILMTAAAIIFTLEGGLTEFCCVIWCTV